MRDKDKCENCYCLYEDDGSCILETCTHSLGGVCMDCIYVEIPDEILKRYKKNN